MGNVQQVAVARRDVDTLQFVSSMQLCRVALRPAALMIYLRIPLREAVAFERFTVIVTLSCTGLSLVSVCMSVTFLQLMLPWVSLSEAPCCSILNPLGSQGSQEIDICHPV